MIDKLVRSRFSPVVLLAATALFGSALCVYGQSGAISGIGNTTTTPVAGVPHDYIQSLNEIVNPANGALSVRIKAPTPHERGANWPTYAYDYESNNQYTLEPQWQSVSNGYGGFYPAITSLWLAGPTLYGTGGQTTEQQITQQVSETDGTGSGPTQTIIQVDNDPADNIEQVSQTDGQGENTIIGTITYSCQATYGQMYTDPDGGLHGLALGVATPGSSPPPPGGACPSFFDFNQFSGGDIQYKAYIPNPTTAPGTTIVMDTHGDLMNITQTTSPTEEDTNGNWANTAGKTTTGRAAPSVTAHSTDGVTTTTLTIPGATTPAGEAGPYTITTGPSSVTPSFTLGSIAQSDGCLYRSILVGAAIPSSTMALPATTTVTLPNGESYTITVDPVYGLINRIIYPTGAWVEYTWGINPSSEVQTWSEPGYCQTIHDWFAIAKRVVSYDGTNADEEQDFCYSTTWQTGNTSNSCQPGSIARPTSIDWTAKSTTVTTKDLIRGTISQTVYNYNPETPPPDTPGQALGKVPVENTISYYDTNGSLLKTVTKTWQSMSLMSAECETLPNGQTSGRFYQYQQYTGFTTFTGLGNQYVNNPLHPEANLTDLPTDVKEFDYTSSLGPGTTACVLPSNSTPTRETKTAYASFGPTQPALFPLPSILDRPSFVQVYGNGVLLSETDYGYDGGNAPAPVLVTGTVAPVGTESSGTPPQTCVSSPIGHDETNFGCASTTPRGNLTTVKKCTAILGNTCTAFGVVTNYTYDTTGQVISVTDPCGNTPCADMTGSAHTTTYSYTDNYANGAQPSGVTNAYPTTITAPATGISGTIAHTTKYQFGLQDGRLWNATDKENNTTTSYCYFTGGFSGSSCSGTPDPFYRLTGVQHPDGGLDAVSYSDAGPTPSVKSSKLLSGTTACLTSGNNTSGSTCMTQETIYDAYGLPTHTQLQSDQYGWDYVDTTYDGMGRVLTKTSPYRTTSDPTYGISTYYYDALGRQIEEVEQDGSVLQTCYNGTPSVPAVANCSSQKVSTLTGPWVDSTDEVGNHWQRTSNALGQLMDVMEPNGTTQAPTMETDYTYNGLSDLLLVKQCGASCSSPAPNGPISRSFSYDSLSRLLTSYNPETGTVSYSYDADSNLSAKTDARGVMTSYTYDALNRVISKTYSSDTSGTPISCFQYDTSSIPGAGGNLIGRLTNAWTQPKGSSSCTGTAPSFAPVAGSYLSLKSILAYDKMGRPASAQQQQCVGSQCAAPTPYSLSMAYDLAGNMTTLTNSVGAAGQPLTLNNYFDAASRPCLTTSSTGNTSWSANFPANLFQVNPSTTTPGYAPFGGLLNWYVGSSSSTASTSCSTTPASPINITQGYTNRLWVNSISATGQIP